MKRPTQIELVIDEVVLHGYPGETRALFAASLERALLRELGSPQLQRALARGARNVSFIDGGALRVPEPGAPRDLGSAVAGGVVGSLLAATSPPGRRAR